MSVVQAGPYPIVEAVANLARALVNDSFPGLTGHLGEGRILTDKSFFFLEYLNSAIAELQDRLINNGVSTFTKEQIFTNFPVVAQVDPGVQVSWSYTGFFNGTTNFPNPLLPNDLLIPLTIRERQTGNLSWFYPMFEPGGQLPSVPQSLRMCYWEWREDAIWMPGTTQPVDLKLRYESRLPFIANTPDFPTTIIPIRGSVNALANMVVYRYAQARGSVQTEMIGMAVDKAIGEMCNRSIRSQQRKFTRPRPYRRGGGSCNSSF